MGGLPSLNLGLSEKSLFLLKYNKTQPTLLGVINISLLCKSSAEAEGRTVFREYSDRLQFEVLLKVIKGYILQMIFPLQ